MKSKTQIQREKIEAIYFALKDNIDYNTLKKWLHYFLTAEKAAERSSFLTSKQDCTVRQKIRHELNCEDLFVKAEVLQMIIDRLSTPPF